MTLADIYVKKEKLKEIISVLDKKGEDGINLTISIYDTPNAYNQNTAVYVSQSEQQRKSEKKYYIGNGNVFWTDGRIFANKPKKEYKEKEEQKKQSGDLPF